MFAKNVIHETKLKAKSAQEHNKKHVGQIRIPSVEEELARRILILSLEWPGTFSRDKTAKLTTMEEKWLTDFSCAEAGCFVPRDRATVLAAIREDWKSEPGQEDGEEMFERFVRVELVKVFAASKAAYKTQLSRTAYKSFEFAFGG